MVSFEIITCACQSRVVGLGDPKSISSVYKLLSFECEFTEHFVLVMVPIL